jgi:uncharacterized membrane protein
MTQQRVPIGVGVTTAAWAVLVATYVACVVEAVEATTIIMAMGFTRSWRSTWLGVATALVALGVVTTIFGYALTSWLPEAALQLVIGGLLLVFGLQWLRKAILRASHRKSIHDEEKIFREQEKAARLAGDQPDGFDMVAAALRADTTDLRSFLGANWRTARKFRRTEIAEVGSSTVFIHPFWYSRSHDDLYSLH